MMTRFSLLALFVVTMCSCQTILRHQLGIKDPGIEKKKNIENMLEKNKIGSTFFLKKEKIMDAYIGPFPKVYVFEKAGRQVILPNCYELVEENLVGLFDTIPNKLSTQFYRNEFVNEHINFDNLSALTQASYDFEVYFYWSMWLGKFNVKKLQLAQKTIDLINQKNGPKSIKLFPVNFDFVEEDGWTKASFHKEFKKISDAQKSK